MYGSELNPFSICTKPNRFV